VINYYKYNFQFILILLTWVTGAYYLGMPIIALIGVFMLLFAQKEWLEELLIGFLFILILSDNLFPSMEFAKSYKNIYILFISFYVFVKRDLFSYKSNIFMYFIPFFFFALIGILYSPAPAVAIQKTISYFLLICIVPTYIVSSFKASGPEFFRNLIFFAFTIILVGYLMRFISHDISFSHGNRFRGIFGNPNGMGIFLITFNMFFHVVRLKFPFLFSRFEALFIYAIIFYLVFITGSRNALLSVILFFIFSFFFRISTVLGIIFFLLVIISTEYIMSNFVAIISGIGLDEELRLKTLEEGSGRLVAWEFAWNEIKRSLFIGRGMGYDEFYMRQNASILTDLGHEGGVHNTYLILWLNSGFFGLLSFMVALFTLFIKASFKNKLALPVLLVAAFSIIFEPWLAASLNPYTIIFFITLTVLLDPVFNNKTNEDKTKPEVLTD
jgi:O-antigen ligase